MHLSTPSTENTLDIRIPEQRIWQAVIIQALMDASANGKRSEIQKAKREARSWLEGESADFLLVCENAGLHPHYVKQVAEHIRKQDYCWRTAPGTAANYEKRGGRKRYQYEKKKEQERLARLESTRAFHAMLDDTLAGKPLLSDA